MTINKKLLMIPGTLFLLGFMPYSGTTEDNAQLAFSEPILELQDVEKLADEEFYRQNPINVLPDADPRSKIPPMLIEELAPSHANREI